MNLTSRYYGLMLLGMSVGAYILVMRTVVHFTAIQQSEDLTVPSTAKYLHLDIPSGQSDHNLTGPAGDWDSRNRNWSAAAQVIPVTDVKIIIIVAYMRTGSTLTGSLFQNAHNSFYVFEPIRALVETLDQQLKQRCTTYTTIFRPKVMLQNFKTRIYRSAEDAILDVVGRWLTCDLDGIDLPGIVDQHHKVFSDSIAPFHHCVIYSEPARCIADRKRQCLGATVRVMKTIRLRMRLIEKLLPWFPNMKIIHLLRDARGIFNSRIRLETVKDFKSEVASHCELNMEDLKVARNIMKTYPNQLTPILYEDLAENPVQVARDLYKFVGLPFTENILQHIKKATNASSDSGMYSVLRKNSAVTAYKWRTQIDTEWATFVGSMCADVNNVLGYKQLTPAAVKDYSVPVRYRLNITHQLLYSRFIK